MGVGGRFRMRAVDGHAGRVPWVCADGGGGGTGAHRCASFLSRWCLVSVFLESTVHLLIAPLLPAPVASP